MSKIVTKEDLLREMWRVNACHAAYKWVQAHDGTADEIWVRCDRPDWLTWFVSVRNQEAIASFAARCAARAASYAERAQNADAYFCAAKAGFAASDASEAAVASTVYSFAAAASTHAYYAAVCARANDEERAIQLAELHAILPSSKKSFRSRTHTTIEIAKAAETRHEHHYIQSKHRDPTQVP